MTDLTSEQITKLEKQQYRVVGNHSVVKICEWCKKSLRDEGVCYKQKFYGIKSHRCLQMSPALLCDQRCLFCWRDTSVFTSLNWIGAIDDPDDIIDGSILAQRKLLAGFYGNPKANKKKLEEAQNPNQAAISLTGEPTLYPKIGELIAAFKRRKFSTFLVTNAAHPEVLEKIELPTQLYMSLDAPNREIHKKLNLPLNENVWDNIQGTIDLFPSLDTRKVIRITAVKKYNMVEPENYAKLIEKSNADFVEVKSYMPVGHSVERLGYDYMPAYEETKNFAKEINEHLGYELTDESIPSKVILLWNKKTPKIIPGIDD